MLLSQNMSPVLYCWSHSHAWLKKYIFNWRKIVLQYCASFCHISTWVSHRYTHVSSLLNLLPTSHPIPPSRMSQNAGFEIPVSHSKFPLAIHFTCGNVYALHMHDFKQYASVVDPKPSSLIFIFILNFHLCIWNWVIQHCFLDVSWSHQV